MLPFEIGTPNNGGAVVTASGLIFISAATDNLMRAIDLRTGKSLWHDALPAGGAFVAIEALIDDARRENVFGLHMSLNMLIEFGDAFDFTAADFNGWCREAGFTRFEVIPLAGPSSAAVAYK